MMTAYVERAGLDVAPELANFVETALLPGLPIAAEKFWEGFSAILQELVSIGTQL